MWTKVASIFMLCLHISQCCSCSINNSWLSKLKIGMHIRLMFLLANGANGVPIWHTENQCSKHLWYVVSLQLHGLHHKCSKRAMLSFMLRECCYYSEYDSWSESLRWLSVPSTPSTFNYGNTTEDILSHQCRTSGYKACYDVSCPQSDRQTNTIAFNGHKDRMTTQVTIILSMCELISL